MSSYFARTLNKAPTYLSPRRRPTLPRTLSNSSEISISSNRSDDPAAETAHSAPGTPTFETQPRKCAAISFQTAKPARSLSHYTHCYSEPPGAAAGGHGNLPPFSVMDACRLHRFQAICPPWRPSPHRSLLWAAPAPATVIRLCLANNLRHLGHPVSPGLSVSRSGTSRPIGIEIPQIQKKNTSSIYTPTEPLSGRGDQPGAYFPLHEDPDLRVRHPHPFKHEIKSVASRPSSAMNHEFPMTQRHATSPGLSIAGSGAKLSSYIPAGFHDQPLPLGKYYPSNYENSSESLRSRGDSYSSDTAPFTRADSHVSSYVPSRSDSKKRLEQYQRDMITQASMALNSYKSTSPAMQSIPDIRFGGTSPHKPMSPRLDPLGSPGPVTPMELETTTTNYLDKSKAPLPFAKRNVKPSNVSVSPRSL